MARHLVTYSGHPSGSPSGSMSRRSKVAAERSAATLRECGYSEVTIEECDAPVNPRIVTTAAGSYSEEDFRTIFAFLADSRAVLRSPAMMAEMSQFAPILSADLEATSEAFSRIFDALHGMAPAV